jgi:nucleoside-triphosphatase THEP1/DNA-binding CsgD family transcriptional regulator
VATVIPDTSNTLFQLAANLVNQSSRTIFLTGKAGTGKTTFLKHIKDTCQKQMAIVAPTGVAAINAGGTTIHSFFQLPLAPFVPETVKFSASNQEVVSRHSLVSRLRINKEKIKVLEQLELLIIDEVSMVRCDTMDAIDAVLRHIRRKPDERFGGVQVLLIGDLFQLSPVIKDQEWRHLSEHYNSPYFFDSLVIREQLPVYIEFNKIYRQSEERFIRLLNQVRNNEVDEEGMEIMESRFQPSFRRHKQDGYIILTTHNERVRDTNSNELKNLEGQVFSYYAEITNEFPENAYPAEEILHLKTGAQVMFIKNDSSDKGKRYFNGKIGTVTRLEKDKIFVQCQGEADEIEVKREKWDNVRYTVNAANRHLEPDVVGSFAQYPLRLAWAITIHKSQGLTFQKAIIDAGEAFAAGQVYVALSRCTSLEGMILQSRVRSQSLSTDPRIVRFSQNCISSNQLHEELSIAKKSYQAQLIVSLFDFAAAVNSSTELKEYLAINESSFNAATSPWIQDISDKLNQSQATARKFHSWLQSQFQLPGLLEENELLQAKTKDGAAHFIKELQAILTLVQNSPVVTDSRLHTKEFNESLKELFAELSSKIHLLKGLNGSFDIEAIQQRKRGFVVPSFSKNAYAGASQQYTQSPHPVLYQQLKKLRDSICAQKDLPVYLVASSKTLDELATYLPHTLIELEQINGFGKVRIETYGNQFLEVIQAYCAGRQLSSLIGEKEPKKKEKKQREKTSPAAPTPKTDTKAESFRLFKEGMAIKDIAETRNLTVQTIGNHLVHYIREGEINIEQLVSHEKCLLIEPLIKNLNGGPIGPVKDALGDAIWYNDIKYVIAWYAFKNEGKIDP